MKDDPYSFISKRGERGELLIASGSSVVRAVMAWWRLMLWARSPESNRIVSALIRTPRNGESRCDSPIWSITKPFCPKLVKSFQYSCWEIWRQNDIGKIKLEQAREKACKIRNVHFYSLISPVPIVHLGENETLPCFRIDILRLVWKETRKF